MLLPLAMSRPASADSTYTEAISKGAVTFVGYDGRTVTCDITEAVFHTSDHTAEVAASPAGDVTDCATNTRIEATISAKDEYGHVHAATGRGADATDVTIDEANTAVTATATAQFGNCDPSRSATCSATTTAAPK